MFTLPFQSATMSQTPNAVLKFTGLEDLKCSIYEINEVQDYGLPQNPLDDGSFIADTIYRNPKKLSIRVLVADSDVSTFVANIDSVQFSNNLFTVTSIANQVFRNMKVVNYSKDINSNIVGKQFYLISLEEVKLVKALVESYKNSKNAGYGNNQQAGTKNNTEKKSTALKGFF